MRIGVSADDSGGEMLVQLLQQLSASDGLASTQEMARSLGVSESLMMDMIDRVVALGYLAQLRPGCGSAPCQSCREKSGCLAGGSARVWSLTDKGKRLIGERAPSSRPETDPTDLSSPA